MAVIMKRNPAAVSVAKHPNLLFWVCFLPLNFLLFAPIYAFFYPDTAFWPLSQRQDGAGLATMLFLQRSNLDIYRLNLEFTLLVGLGAFVLRMRSRISPWLRRFLFVTAVLLYLAQLVYAAYEGFMRAQYLLDPIFYNDFPLFLNGARYVWQSMDLSAWLYPGLLLLGGVILLIALLHGLLFKTLGSGRLSQATLLGLALVTLAAVASFWLSDARSGSPETAVSSFTAKIIHNADLSQAAQSQAASFDSRRLASFYQFTAQDLAHKPNIYLIFIESYGSVLYQRADFRRMYTLVLRDLTRHLDERGWLATSTRSIAPTWGGGSWISYTSLLTGLRLDAHTQYLDLLNQYHTESFPHLLNYLRSQGYRSYSLSSNADEISDVEWQRYKHFYGIDQWWRFSDLDYSGQLYGWGPAPPDQYAINYAHAAMQRAGAPAVFFYVTQNSHYPWTPLPVIVDDWRTLNDAEATMTDATGSVIGQVVSRQRLSHTELRYQYMASIEYELRMLIDFITREGRENDVFVLVGDHQPARVARYEDGWDTPMHIISRDAAFIDAFTAYNFVPGLATKEVEPRMHHEGFYTLFMRILLQQYGAEQINLPDYLPNGAPLN
jgi:hypothetical protein